MADILILAIETATGCGGVALTRVSDDGSMRILAEYTLQPEVTHSRQLLGSVAAIMAATGIGWSDLNGVAVSRGPGSFTGLRIGMAAAQGIAMAAGVPLLGIPTLDGLAVQIVAADQPVCCVLDARKQQVYAAFYRHADKQYRRTSGFLVLSPEALAARIEEPTLVVGPGVQACGSALSGLHQVRLAPVGACHPRAAMIGWCGARRLHEGMLGLEEDVVPLYVRASEAELNLQEMQGSRGEAP